MRVLLCGEPRRLLQLEHGTPLCSSDHSKEFGQHLARLEHVAVTLSCTLAPNRPPCCVRLESSHGLMMLYVYVFTTPPSTSGAPFYDQATA